MAVHVARLGSGKCTVIGTLTFSDFPSPRGASSGQMDKRRDSPASTTAMENESAASAANALDD